MNGHFHIDEAATETQLREAYARIMKNRPHKPREIEWYIQFTIWLLSEMADGVEPEQLLDKIAKGIATMILSADEHMVGPTDKAFADQLIQRVDYLVFEGVPEFSEYINFRFEAGGHA